MPIVDKIKWLYWKTRMYRLYRMNFTRRLYVLILTYIRVVLSTVLYKQILYYNKYRMHK